MCLAIPGQIQEINGTRARVDFDGLSRAVDCSFVEQAKPGDWVIVHVGFAIQTVEEGVARETYRLLAKIRKQDLEDELSVSDPKQL